jgi:hypothetical protein
MVTHYGSTARKHIKDVCSYAMIRPSAICCKAPAIVHGYMNYLFIFAVRKLESNHCINGQDHKN